MMIFKKTKNNKGFVILFAVTLAAVILAITLGVVNIALQELKFGTSAEDTNNSFFAADTGAECALMNDKGSSSAFPLAGPGVPISCIGIMITPIFTSSSDTGRYDFVVAGLGSGGKSCANVSVFKDNTNPSQILTTIIAKGYNAGDSSCFSSDSYRVERELKVSY